MSLTEEQIHKNHAAYWQAILAFKKKKLLGKTKGLSYAGLIFESPVFMNVGETCKVRIQGYHGSKKIDIQLEAEVTYWALTRGGHFDIGAKYLSMTEKGKETVLNYIKEKE